MTPRLVLHPEPPCTCAGVLRRAVVLERMGDGSRPAREVLWYEFPEETVLPAGDQLDAFVIATCMTAMQEGRTLEIRGAVSECLLRNLAEYAVIWSRWLPLTYGQVEFAPERTVSRLSVRRGNGVLAAFSGGVDASFLVWTHHQKRRGWQSQPISHCMLAHGFDIPLAEPESFRAAFSSGQETLRTLPLPLVWVRTNFRSAVPTKWTHACGAAIASCFHHFAETCGTALIASSAPYGALVIPWGSNPITDHLFSSDAVDVLHDGAAFDRTCKVGGIADWEAGLNGLRVCWEGRHHGRNCGRCEKCIRTKLNFLVNRRPVPASLGGELRRSDLLAIQLKNVAVHQEYSLILQSVRRQQLEDPWVAALETLLRREALARPARVACARLKQRVKRVLGR